MLLLHDVEVLNILFIKHNFMKKLVLGLVLVSMAYGCSPKLGDSLKNPLATETPIATAINLANVTNDKVWVEIDPGLFTQSMVTYRLPKVVQGTYAVSDFGSFVDSLKAFDYSGNVMPSTKIDANSWTINNAQKLDKIVYYVNDTFDIERTDKPTPFSPSGTNIADDNYMLNLHGFIGYFDELKNSQYTLQVTAPASFEKSSALERVSSTSIDEGTTVVDVYHADRYFDITDNPMMYGDLDTEEFQVGDIKIVLSVYSPNGVHTAAEIKKTVFEMMKAQKSYLGEMNSTSRYDIYLYLADQNETSPTGFGALEHHTSTVVVLPEAYPVQALSTSMIDVVSHEFFHIVTPLSVHSEDVHDFDYNAPTFSKHLWMYEGVTEYFASHFQVYEGLQIREKFYSKINDKISTSLSLADDMSFTEMSENILDEPYASNYYNVYMKGALIGMCVDILMREESNGQRSILSLLKQLSEKYGKTKPFEDDDLIAEITAMTYPSIGEFLTTHVVGGTPIDYEVFFDKVGLEMGEEAIQTTLLFVGQVPFIDANPSTKEIFFRDIELNSSLNELGIQAGDVLKSVDGTKYTLDNIRPLIQASFLWTSETDISFVVIRDGEEVELTGKVGSPVLMQGKLMENAKATEEQVQLRNWWLEK